MENEIRFEWDQRKSESNRRKHGIDFETAKLVFNDPFYVTEYEGDVHGEARWRATGQIGGVIVVLVSHTLHEEGEDEVVRIISARKASLRERQKYEEGL